MHTLLLLRHAKAENSMGVSDHKRPLSSQGIADASVVAQRLEESGYKPDLVISSNALRAMITAEVFTSALKTDLVLNHELYNAYEQSVLDLIRAMDEEVRHLMLVGHNPTWEMLVEDFTGESVHMSPCSLVQISFEGSWEGIKGSEGKIIYTDTP